MSKIFGIGLSRTGSTSLTEALTILGLRAAHFPADPVTQREYFEFFASPADTLRLSLLDHCDAVTDSPVCCVYRQLDQTYPGSKFIWTIRDKDSWLRSCEAWWERSVIPFMEHSAALGAFMRLAGTQTYGSAYFDAGLFSAAYDDHMTQVPGYFRGRDRDLLTLNICGGEGWPELASFLGRAIPDVPFPHRNDLTPAGS